MYTNNARKTRQTQLGVIGQSKFKLMSHKPNSSLLTFSIIGRAFSDIAKLQKKNQ